MVRRQVTDSWKPAPALAGRRGSPLGSTGRWWLVLIALVAVGSTAGCAGDERPTEAAWLQQWQGVVAEVPDPSQADDLEPDECERLLVTAREARPELEPAPAEALDQSVIQWLNLAEEVGFECEDTEDLREVLVEMKELEGRIREGLEADADG